MLFELFMYGSRESCYHDMEESVEDWKTHCAFRTYWLAAAAAAAVMIAAVGLNIFMLCTKELQEQSLKQRVIYFVGLLFAGALCAMYVGSAIFLPQTIIGYPGIILADLAHWHVAHLPLGDLAGTTANAIYLTGNDTVRVAAEYAVSADGECIKSKKVV
jgi:hypothetical protein